MEKNADITIVIPVYRTDPLLLGRGLKSIAAQTVRPKEVIIVQDEESGQYLPVIEPFRDFLCVHLLTQDHKGVSSARNVGIRQALGSYLLFMDADDELLPDALSVFIGASESEPADVIASGYIRCMGGSESPNAAFSRECRLSRESAAQAVLNPQSGLGFVWAKMFRTAYLTQQQLLFSEDLSMAEDAEFMLRAVLHADAVHFLPRPTYRYYLTQASAVRQWRPDYAARYERALSAIEADLEHTGLCPALADAYCLCVVYHLLLIIINDIFHPQRPGSCREKLRLLSRKMKEPLYRRSVKRVKPGAFSLSRRVCVLFLKLHLYPFVALVAKIRHRQFQKAYQST